MAIGGPRRLKTSTENWWPARGAPARRKGAGLLCARAWGGRRAINGVQPAWAARCSRRSVADITGRSFHHSTAAQLPARSACSAAQAPSARLAGWTQTSRGRPRPSACSAATQGQAGGAIQSRSREPASRCASPRSQGASRASSPLAAGISSSVRPARGQPPSGSSASRAGQPVGAVGRRLPASCPARHNDRSRPGANSASVRAAGRSGGRPGRHEGARDDMAAVEGDKYCT